MSTSVFDVTDATFEQDVIQASRRSPVVVDFWAAWCGPCRALGPQLEAAVEATPGVALAKLDTDHNPATAMRYGIRSIPAVKAFSDGGVVDEFIGLQPRHRIDQFLARLTATTPDALPADETGLRSLLQAQPQNLAARQALVRVLLAAGRLDDASAELPPDAIDPVSDGLRARIELARGGDGVVPEALKAAITPAQELDAMPELVDAIRREDGERKAALRRAAVGVLAAHPEDTAVAGWRSRLASALF